MMDAAPAMFRPTWSQALGRGLYLGAVASLVGFGTVLLVTGVVMVAGAADPPPGWLWVLVLTAPPVAGALIAVPAGRMTGTQIGAGGIRVLSAGGRRTTRAGWNEVVDLRAERRGGRTVVSVYLASGGSLQLRAPYTGELFAEDPRFDCKIILLSYLWRSHRFSGLRGG